MQVKRWHDRDKPGWWVLINLVPFIGPLWALVENGFLPGEPGANRYGPPSGATPQQPPRPRPGVVPVLPDLHERKQCPHCGEFIRTEAARCEWCDRQLAPGWHHAMP